MGKTASKLQVLNLDEKYFLCKIPPVLGEETFGLLQAQNKTSREKALGDSTKATKRKVGSNLRENLLQIMTLKVRKLINYCHEPFLTTGGRKMWFVPLNTNFGSMTVYPETRSSGTAYRETWSSDTVSRD